MGKNKDGRRSTRKNSKKNTFNKYGKYTTRCMRIFNSQIKESMKCKKINLSKIVV